MNNKNDTGGRSLASAGNRMALISLIMTLAAFAISVNALPPVITSMSAELGISIETFGFLFSMQFLVFMVVSFAGGSLIEKTGIKPGLLIIIGLFGLSASFLIIPLISGFWSFLPWILVLGFCGGLIETFASILTTSYDRAGSGRILSLSQAFYCIGAIAAPQIVSILFQKQVQWKSIFILFGFMELAIAAVFVTFSFKDIRGRIPMSERGISLTPGIVKISIFRDIRFLLLAFSIFVYVFNESFLIFWLPAYFEKFYTLSPAQAALRLSFYWYGLICGRIIMTFIPVKFSLRRIIILSSVGILICSIILSFRLGNYAAILFVILIGFFSGPVWASIVAIGKNTSKSPLFLAGIIGAGALGASAGPLVSSFIIGSGAFNYFFPTLFLGALILLALVIISDISIKKEKRTIR